MDIREEDTIRARENGKWYTDFKASKFRDKSSDRYPTYGNCPFCFKAGPIGRQCNECNKENNIYCVIMYGMNPLNGHHMILDAENIARVFNKTIEVAKADRQYRWLRTPTQVLIEEYLTKMVKQFIQHELLKGISNTSIETII